MWSYLRQVLRPAHAGRRTAVAVMVVCAVAGVALIFTDQLARTSPPPLPAATMPPAPMAAPPAGRAPGQPSTRARTSGAAAPTRPLTIKSPPTRVDIPAIEVAAPLMAVGTTQVGTIDVPPAKKPYLAGWYRDSVTPGQPGRTVIVGHLDSKYSGPAVFYELGALRAGARISVSRADGIIVTYVVDGASHQAKNRFPAAQIYQASKRSELRLVTCGGTYNKGTGWSDNVIVYAHMVSWHRATADEKKRPLRLDTPHR